MQPRRVPVAAAVPPIAVAGLLLLAGCAGGPREAAAPASSAAVSVSSSPASSAPASDDDACALVPAAQLRAAVGGDPGQGVPSTGRLDGGRCTWRISAAHTAVAQLTRQPDAYLPDSVWQRPQSAADVPGTDRGWASAETHSILLVEGGRGLLFTDVGLRRADQEAYDALAEAIAARL